MVRNLKKSKSDDAETSLKVEKQEILLSQLRNTGLDDLVTVALASLDLGSAVDDSKKDATPAVRRVLAVKCVATLLHTVDVEALNRSTVLQPMEEEKESGKAYKFRKIRHNPKTQEATNPKKEKSKFQELENITAKNSCTEANGHLMTAESEGVGFSSANQPKDQGTESKHPKYEAIRGNSNNEKHVARLRHKKPDSKHIKKTKNRLGQRARRKLFTSQVKQQGAHGFFRGQMHNTKERGRGTVVNSRTDTKKSRETGEEKLHPSWELKRRQTRLEKPQGKRIVFGEDT